MYVFKALVSTAICMVTEFQFIDNIKSKYALNKLGDDCAVLPKDDDTDLLVTSDMLVEDIDFQLDWTTPEFLGHKALAVSLSDIAAMGGDPKWSMLSIGVPENVWDTEFLDRFYAGWFGLANEYGVELVGGDVSRSPDKVVIDSIAGGEVAKGKAIMRSGAESGDAIYVTGKLGGATGGLKLLERSFTIIDDLPDLTSNLLLKQLKPIPQIQIGNSLQQLGIVTSMIDVSDGISSDLAHICAASRTGAQIYADRLPIDGDLSNYFHSNDYFDMALNGGEDFELVFTVSKKNIPLLESLPATCIGEITAKPGLIELIRDGKAEILKSEGYRHF